MITFLEGKLVEALPTQVTVAVHGVGYEVLIPLSSYDKLPPPGGAVKLLTHLAVREDAHVLYGFMTAAERELFRLLINTVSGIGPKIALNILSGMNATSFRGAVAMPHRAKWHQRLAAALVFGLIRGLAATIRFELDDRSGLLKGAPTGKIIFSIWHNRLALSLMMYRRYVVRFAPERRMAAMVSA